MVVVSFATGGGTRSVETDRFQTGETVKLLGARGLVKLHGREDSVWFSGSLWFSVTGGFGVSVWAAGHLHGVSQADLCCRGGGQGAQHVGQSKAKGSHSDPSSYDSQYIL